MYVNILASGNEVDFAEKSKRQPCEALASYLRDCDRFMI